jgi:hypothetical protein
MQSVEVLTVGKLFLWMGVEAWIANNIHGWVLLEELCNLHGRLALLFHS